jgi:hypothetical protein
MSLRVARVDLVTSASDAEGCNWCDVLLVVFSRNVPIIVGCLKSFLLQLFR